MITQLFLAKKILSLLDVLRNLAHQAGQLLNRRCLSLIRTISDD